MKTKKLKGSVLFTVIAVMMVVLVFVMSALTIAGATSRRAYSDYSKAQTKYTAHAALEATMKYLRDYVPKDKDESGTVLSWKNNELGSAVAGLKTTSDEIKLTVSFGNADPSEPTNVAKATNDPSVGTAEVRIKCINDKYMYTDGNEHAVIAITAIATLAGETSEETMIVLKDPKVNDNPLGGPNSLTSMAGADFGSNNPFVFGGVASNISGTSTGTTFKAINNGIITGVTVINSDFDTAADTKMCLGKGEGLAVYGDLQGSNSLTINAYADGNKSDGKYTVNEVPYIFVEKMCNFSTYSSIDINGMLNIFCGGFSAIAGNNNLIDFAGGNIYAFDPTMDIDIEANNGQNYTKLLSWVATVTNPGGNKISAGNIMGKGNVILKNKSDTTEDIVIGGSILSEKDVTIEGKSKEKTNFIINGALQVRGKLTITNATVTCSKLVMPEPTNVDKSESVFLVGGKDYDSGASLDSEDVNYPEEYTAVQLTGDPKYDSSATIKPEYQIVQTVVNDTMLKYVSFDEKPDGTKVPNFKPKYFHTEEDMKDNIAHAQTHVYDDSNVPHLTNYITSTNYPTTGENAGKFVVPESEKIKTHCVIKGGLNKKQIVIEAAAADEEIWVILEPNGQSYQNGCSFIITGEGSVKFFTTSSVTFGGQEDGRINGIYTDFYYKKYFLDNELVIHETPDDLHANEIPKVYFYMDYKKTGNDLKLENGAKMTAYIFAPTATLFVGDSAPKPPLTYIKADGSTIEANANTTKTVVVDIIGSAFVGNYNTINDVAFVYVNNTAESPAPDPTEYKTTWAVLSYQAGNEFMYK